MDVYENCPSLETERFVIRQTVMEDCGDLLTVYSDERAVPLFNSDNCHGDDFHYRTMERMSQAIVFWNESYQRQDFVRWTIIEKRTKQAVGTIELFHRDAEDDFTNTGLLRLDLRSDREQTDFIEEILSRLIEPAYEWFACGSLTTKVVPEARERRMALHKLGFQECINTLKGHCGESYGSYFMRCKNA